MNKDSENPQKKLQEEKEDIIQDFDLLKLAEERAASAPLAELGVL